MVATGARARSLATLLERAGIGVAASGPPAPRIVDLSPILAESVMGAFRRLDGSDAAPLFRPGSWDLPLADGFVLELDEELHFNRYRAATLNENGLEDLPWARSYMTQCSDFESACLSAGTWGKRWTNPSCERFFGPAGPAGNLDGPGAPRWKQRALYDSFKDAAARSGSVKLIRLSVHDEVDGESLESCLRNGRASHSGLHTLVEQRRFTERTATSRIGSSR